MTPEARDEMVRRLHRRFAEMMRSKCEPPQRANTGAAQASHNVTSHITMGDDI